MIGRDDQLIAELVALGHGTHWSLGDLLDLDHSTRRRFLDQVRRAQSEAGGAP